MKQADVDSLGWPILSQEEEEFLRDRGWRVILAANNAQMAARPGHWFNTARFELDLAMAHIGGDPIWRQSPHHRGT